MLKPDSIINIDYKQWKVTMSGHTYATVINSNGVMRIIKVKDYI